MARIPKKIEDRIRAAIKRFAPLLQLQKDRDVSEADTVTLVKDLFAELFGFDKYAELTSEHQIRGTYCDLAVRIEGKLRLLVEVKAIGLALNDRHVKQAVDYAANQGLDLVMLTNAIQWRLFRIEFRKPIEAKPVTEFDLLQFDPRQDDDLERVFMLTREGMLKGAIQEFTDRKEATSRFLIASLLVNDEDVANTIRRELRKVTDRLVTTEDITAVLRQEVIKRETLEGEEALDAAKLVIRRTRPSRDRPPADAAGSPADSTPSSVPEESKPTGPGP